MLRFFKGLLSRKVKEPQHEAPYKVETPVETISIPIEGCGVVEVPVKLQKAKKPAKPKTEKKPVEKKPAKPRAKKAAK